MSKPPAWASALVLSVLKGAERAVGPDDDASAPLVVPELVWRRAHGRVYWNGVRPFGSAGRSVGDPQLEGHISISAGSDRTDAKLVLLHELAHWLNENEGHTARFWDTAWALYRQYKVPLRYARQREEHYRKGSRAGYLRNVARKRTE